MKIRNGFLVSLLAHAAIGAALGAVAGFALLAFGLVANPYWFVAIGIFAGAIIVAFRLANNDIDS